LQLTGASAFDDVQLQEQTLDVETKEERESTQHGLVANENRLQEERPKCLKRPDDAQQSAMEGDVMYANSGAYRPVKIQRACIGAILSIVLVLCISCGSDSTSSGSSNPYGKYTREMITPIYVPDAVSAFNALPTHGLYVQAYTNNNFDYGCCDASSHIQGIQRLRDSDYLVLSSNDNEVPRARIAIVRINSTPGDEYLASNENPPPDDMVVKVWGFPGPLNHAGGMATCGDILVVPIEGGGTSEIHFLFMPKNNPEEFYDLSDKYENAIVRRPHAPAGAVALTRFPTGPHKDHYLLAVLTDGHDGPLDFYLSNTEHIFDGFQFVSQWDGVSDPVFHGNQNMDFIMEPDGDIFLLGTDNTNWLFGADWGELYRVEFGDQFANPRLTLVASKHFYASDHGNFDGGAGLYVNRDGKVALYTSEPFSSNLKLKMMEFGWPQEISEYYVVLYDDSWFRDRRLTLWGTTGHYLPNYHHIYVSGEWGFNDKVSSAQWKLPPGKTYVLYENNTYGGNTLKLVGTGEAEEIGNFDDKGFGDKTSASKFEN
jgi:hypothetical protein